MRGGRGVCCATPFLLVFASARVADAAPPRSITDLAGASSLSDEQKSRVGEYAEYWVGQFGGGPEEVNRARVKLLEPMKAPQVSEFFRLEYGRRLLGRLDGFIGGENPHAAVNAMQVTGFLGTPDALDLILAHCDLQDEKRVDVRLWAAKSLFITVSQPVLGQGDVSRGLRRVAAAASHEDRWLVLQRQFEAVAAVDTRVARDVQIDLLVTTARRMADSPGPSDLMRATVHAVQLLRETYMKLPRPEQEGFGAVLAPVLGEVVKVADRHWDPVQGNGDAREIYRKAVEACEGLLNFIDRLERPGGSTPQGQLSASWKNRDARRFREGLSKWQETLKGPPYKSP